MSKAIFLSFLIISTFEETAEANAMNVAWNGKLELCSKPVESSGIFDGNRFKLSVTITEDCDKDITVMLGKWLTVDYVVLYGGETAMHGVARFDAEFRVFSRREICGNFIRRRTIEFRGMRVNCIAPDKSDRVFVDVKRVPFYLNEIEVYSFDFDDKPMVYRGCFKLFPTHKSYPYNEHLCKLYCASHWMTFLAISACDCFCSSEIDETKEIPEKECAEMCGDNTRTCPCDELHTFSVFTVKLQLPAYKSCLDDFNVTNVTEADDMTIVKCLQLCDDSYYAALKNGKFCGCFNSTPHFEELEDTNCSKPCFGDPNFYCGGVSEWSVYRTCKDCMMKTMPCSKLLRCSGDYDVYGVCKGGCKDGRYGQHCIEKEVKFLRHLGTCNNGTCKDNANSYCYHNKMTNSSHCYCLDGFWDVKDGKTCEDIDECLYEACDNKISTCENVMGSYKCNCKSGYYQLTDLICGVLGKKPVKTVPVLIIVGATMMSVAILGMTFGLVWIRNH